MKKDDQYVSFDADLRPADEAHMKLLLAAIETEALEKPNLAFKGKLDGRILAITLIRVAHNQEVIPLVTKQFYITALSEKTINVTAKMLASQVYKEYCNERREKTLD